jgi:hypothetical protein
MPGNAGRGSILSRPRYSERGGAKAPLLKAEEFGDRRS